MDRQPLTATSLVPNFMLNNHLSALTVRCLHAGAMTGAAANCGWSGRLDALRAHLGRACPLEPAACQWAGCSATAARMVLAAHEAGCRHRLVACTHAGCSKRLTPRVLASHTARCFFAPVPCANAGCAVEYHRQQAEAHKAVCAFEIVACPVAGCAGRVARGAMATHIQVESAHHILLLSSRLVAAEERATAAEQRADDSTSKLTSLTREVEELKRLARKRKRDDDAANAGGSASGAAPDAAAIRFRPMGFAQAGRGWSPPPARRSTPSLPARWSPPPPLPAPARLHAPGAPPPAALPAATTERHVWTPSSAVRAAAARAAAAPAPAPALAHITTPEMLQDFLEQTQSPVRADAKAARSLVRCTVVHSRAALRCRLLRTAARGCQHHAVCPWWQPLRGASGGNHASARVALRWRRCRRRWAGRRRA
jgi:hypothetical protein